MVRRWLWQLRVRWPNLGLGILVIIGLLIGAASGWWFTLKDWQRDEYLFRARWKLGELLDVAKPEPRPYRYFANCNEARMAGYGSIPASEPSYRRELDDDQDGIACEPWPGNGRRWRRFRF